jgi:hypothetical protein
MLPRNRARQVLTFGNVRRFFISGIGFVLAGKGILERQWLPAIVGFAIVAYGLLAPG